MLIGGQIEIKPSQLFNHGRISRPRRIRLALNCRGKMEGDEEVRVCSVTHITSLYCEIRESSNDIRDDI